MQTTTRLRTVTIRTVAVLGAVALAMGACGSADSEDMATTASDAATDADLEVAEPDESWDEPDAEGPAADDAGGAPERDTSGEAQDTGDVPLTATPASIGRRVIRTAQLVLQVERPAEAAQEVFAVAERRGGFVAETDLERDAEGVVSGSITLRVPSAQLVDAVEELDALASAVPVRRIDETDVTSEATDLEARIRNLTNYETELNGLLADVRETTDRPDDLLTVFERIRSVREEIDRLDARLAVIADQVALSTISVTLQPAERALPVVDPTWSIGDQVREALTATARALQGIADAAIWIVLTAMPVLLVLGSPVLAGALVWRRRTAASAARDS